jgi:hypothetical protein
VALHGEVKVNHMVIATWQAVRRSETPGELNVYDCLVTQHDPLLSVSFIVTHWYDDGALALAQQVLKQAHLELARITVG